MKEKTRQGKKRKISIWVICIFVISVFIGVFTRFTKSKREEDY